MEKFDKFIRNYDYSKVDQLPKFIKRRLDALKKIQLQHVDLLHQYHQEIQDLEMKYEKLYQPLYEQRFKIVNGEHEPTDEECQLPPTINHESDDQENKVENEVLFSPQEEKELESQVKGIPGFWLGCLLSSYNFNDSIEPHDRSVLKHLKDIRLSYEQNQELLIYKLEFLFEENPYFTNQVLTKTYFLKLSPDEKDPFCYEGFEVIRSEGCDILWNPGKNVTVKTVTVKQQNKRDGRTREKKKEVDTDSFFQFFKPPNPPENGEIDEETSALMAVDFELGEVIRQNLIPRAPLLYSGHIVDSDDDDLDDEEDDDESDGCDYDSEMDNSSTSSDSLSKDGKEK